MFTRVKQVAIAFTAVIAMSAPAMAATIIDFRNSGASAGGSITFDGTDVFGAGLPINAVEIFGAPARNGVYDVDGTVLQPAGELGDGVYGSLDFNTLTNVVSLTGCIPGLGVGIGVNGACTPVLLLNGTITGFTITDNSGGSRIEFQGFDTKNADLLTAIGIPGTTPFFLDTFALLTGTLTPTSGPLPSISTDVRNTAVPEPATMMLLGTGLLAAFKARRRKTA